LITQLLTIRSHTPTGKMLKVGFHKARFLALYFFFFISMIATKDANIVLFADDTSIKVTNYNDTHLTVVMN